MLAGPKLNGLIERYKAAMFTVNRRMTALLREEMPGDLTLDQFAIIQYVGTREDCTSTELADVFCVGKSSITAIVTRLVDKGLIVRSPDDKDRRVLYLRLTEAGGRLAADLNERIGSLLGAYVSAFDEAEADQFIETYEKLARAVMDSGSQASEERSGEDS
ncbi:MarR family winged helix-turn-helix transcriptional regulator [Cohnella sp. GCM10012308]|uniref:MarR family winged helix-turn-helix transcriptional regulator n=1 Tax=Cohnella sp. GCM10012308 TaxID=3317329 RepID=UPI003612BE8F